MICIYGMSDKLGNLSLRKREEEVFLGRDIFANENFIPKKQPNLLMKKQKE